MARVIALTQFVFITLGTMALNVLVKTETSAPDPTDQLRTLLTRYGIWLILIPALWGAMAEVIVRTKPGGVLEQSVNASGITIAVIIFAIYGWLILSF